MVRLRKFSELLGALKEGREVRVVVEYAKCVLKIDEKEEPAPNAIGGATLHSWEYFGRGVVRNDRAYIAASETVLIAHPRHGHVFNYVRFRFYEDNKVEITARYLKTSDYEIVMDETFLGELSSGKDSRGVACFTERG